MSDDKPVALEAESPTSMVEQLGKAFTELKSHEDAPENQIPWKEIEEYFNNLEKSLKKKFDELEEKEKAFMEKESETRTAIAEREAAVTTKEQASLDRVQELKEAAVAVISEAREKYKPLSPEPVVDDTTENKVNSSFNDDLDAANPAPEDSSPLRSGEHSMAVEVQPRPELTQFCEHMDAKGLMNFIMENQKNLTAIHQEIPVALKVASEPARLVLDSLEGFYPPPDQNTDESNEQTTLEGNKNDAALMGMRRSCVVLMESVAPFLVATELGVDDPISPEIKQQAKTIADEWKSKLVEADINTANQNSLEAEAFLQLLSIFKIASKFDEEELCKLVLDVAHCRKAPELCRSLGLTHKIPDVVESLINHGRQIDAVHFVQAFELGESFPPVPLLKTYLKDLRRNSQGKGANSGENDANAQELAALKAVIKCVKDYKLDAGYPLDPLQKRHSQLEKSKSDKKRTGEVVKHQQPKKPRANGGYYGSRMSYGAADRQPPQPVYGQMGGYAGPKETYPQVGATGIQDLGPSQGVYGQQDIPQRSYYYPPDERVTAASYNVAPSNYGTYTSSTLPSSHQPYM